MAEITIADATPRVQYTVGGSSTTGPWTIPWPYYETGDIKVYFDSTLKTISTQQLPPVLVNLILQLLLCEIFLLPEQQIFL